MIAMFALIATVSFSTCLNYELILVDINFSRIYATFRDGYNKI